MRSHGLGVVHKSSSSKESGRVYSSDFFYRKSTKHVQQSYRKIADFILGTFSII